MAGRNNCWLFVYNVVRLRHRSDICLLAYHTGVLKKGYSLNITPRVYYVMKASLESETIIDFINSHKRELREKLAVDDAETARNYILTHRDEVKEWLFSTEDLLRADFNPRSTAQKVVSTGQTITKNTKNHARGLEHVCKWACFNEHQARAREHLFPRTPGH